MISFLKRLYIYMHIFKNVAIMIKVYLFDINYFISNNRLIRINVEIMISRINKITWNNFGELYNWYSKYIYITIINKIWQNNDLTLNKLKSMEGYCINHNDLIT